MKNLLKKLHINLFIFIIFIIGIQTIQDAGAQDCGTVDFPGGNAPYANDFFGGYLKPQRTDRNDTSASPSQATFNMLFCRRGWCCSIHQPL